MLIFIIGSASSELLNCKYKEFNSEKRNIIPKKQKIHPRDAAELLHLSGVMYSFSEWWRQIMGSATIWSLSLTFRITPFSMR